MDITLHSSGPVTFVILDGEMTRDNCMEVRDMIMEVLAVRQHFVIDVRSMPLNPVAVGMFVSLVREVEFMDGEIKFVDGSGELSSNAESGFEVYERTEDAVEAFGIVGTTEAQGV